MCYIIFVMNSIKNCVSKFTNSFKKVLLSVNFWDYATVILCFLCSGYALFTSGDTIYRTIATLLSCFITLIRYLLNYNFDFITEFKENKKKLLPTPSYFCFILIGLSATFTLFLNKESSYFISYIYFGVVVINAVLMCRVIKLKRFVNIFCQLLTILSCISIILFFIQILTGSIIGFYAFETNISIISNFAFINFQNIFLNRLQSIFWEPGVFASFLLLGSAFEIFVIKEKHNFRLIVFLFSLILTFSTAAYLLYLLILGIYIDDLFQKKGKNKAQMIFEILFFPILIVLIVIVFVFPDKLSAILPSVFNKLVDSNQSMTTRLYSPLINLKIFIKKPVFGAGIHGANSLYAAELVNYSDLMDAQTSTTTSLLSKFGILGLIPSVMLIAGPLMWKKTNLFKRICFVILFFCIINKEPHENILLTWIFIFYFIYESADVKIIKNRFSINLESSNTLKNKLTRGDKNASLLKNTIASVLVKIAALLISFFSVPIFSKFYNNEIVYGVWLTILSIINWVITFDLGLGNGMKNKLIQSLAKGDKEEGKKIVSSTYLSSSIIGLGLLLVGLCLINSLDLSSLLNVDKNLINPFYLKISFSIVYTTIAIEFVLKNITQILQAYQRHALSNLVPLISTVLLQLFALIFNTNSTQESKLMSLSIVYCVGSLLPYIFITFLFFLTSFKDIRPSFKYASFKKSKSIMSLGLSFFVIQLSLLFLNSMDQFVLSNIFGPESVVFYTKYTKPFHIVITMANVVFAIIWAKVCELVSLNKTTEVKKSIKQVILLDVGSIVLCGIFCVFLQPIMDLWLGSSTIKIDYQIAGLIFIFTSENILVNSFSSILNGFQYLKPQAIPICISAILKIPLVYTIHFLFPSIGWELLMLLNCILWVPILVSEIFGVRKKIKISQRGPIYENKQI